MTDVNKLNSELHQRRFITIMEACKIAHVSRRTIYNWINNKKVTIYRTPSKSVRLDIKEILVKDND